MKVIQAFEMFYIAANTVFEKKKAWLSSSNFEENWLDNKDG